MELQPTPQPPPTPLCSMCCCRKTNSFTLTNRISSPDIMFQINAPEKALYIFRAAIFVQKVLNGSIILLQIHRCSLVFNISIYSIVKCKKFIITFEQSVTSPIRQHLINVCSQCILLGNFFVVVAINPNAHPSSCSTTGSPSGTIQSCTTTKPTQKTSQIMCGNK